MTERRTGRAIAWLRLALWLSAALLFTVQLFHHQIGFFVPLLAIALVLLTLAVQQVERRARRPLKNYLRVGIASAAGALLFVALPAYWQGSVWIGAILWVGFSMAGLAWCIHFERTEPR